MKYQLATKRKTNITCKLAKYTQHNNKMSSFFKNISDVHQTFLP